MLDFVTLTAVFTPELQYICIPRTLLHMNLSECPQFKEPCIVHVMVKQKCGRTDEHARAQTRLSTDDWSGNRKNQRPDFSRCASNRSVESFTHAGTGD